MIRCVVWCELKIMNRCLFVFIDFIPYRGVGKEIKYDEDGLFSKE